MSQDVAGDQERDLPLPVQLQDQFPDLDDPLGIQPVHRLLPHPEIPGAPPTSGGYTLYGRKDTDKDISRSRRRMGAVVETPSIYLDMTAQDNLKYQYRILGLPSGRTSPGPPR